MDSQRCKGSLLGEVQGQEVHSEGVGRDRNLRQARGMPGHPGRQEVESDQPAGESNSYFHLERRMVCQQHCEREATASTRAGQALRGAQGFDPPLVFQRVLDGVHLQGRRRRQTGESSDVPLNVFFYLLIIIIRSKASSRIKTRKHYELIVHLFISLLMALDLSTAKQVDVDDTLVFSSNVGKRRHPTLIENATTN